MIFKGHKIIVIGDTHDSPKIEQDRFVWIGKYIKESKPDYIIQIGDWASFDSLSYFQKNSTQAGKLKDAYMVDIESMRRSIDLLDNHINNDKRILNWFTEDGIHMNSKGHLWIYQRLKSWDPLNEWKDS